MTIAAPNLWISTSEVNVSMRRYHCVTAGRPLELEFAYYVIKLPRETWACEIKDCASLMNH
jgi:hypothetical protein